MLFTGEDLVATSLGALAATVIEISTSPPAASISCWDGEEVGFDWIVFFFFRVAVSSNAACFSDFLLFRLERLV